MNVNLAIHEIGEVVSLKRFIKYFNINVIFDIGANTGQYAKLLRDKVDFKGAIFSFEPFSKSYEILKQNSKNDNNWHVFNYAISNKSGSAKLNLVGSSQMNSLENPTTVETKILSNLNSKIGSENVKLKTLDQIYEEIKVTTDLSNTLLKLDTQGHDLKIIQESKILNNLCGIQTEVSFKILYEDAPKYNEIIDFLKKKGFELTAIFQNNPGHFPWCIEQDILAFNTRMLKK